MHTAQLSASSSEQISSLISIKVWKHGRLEIYWGISKGKISPAVIQPIPRPTPRLVSPLAGWWPKRTEQYSPSENRLTVGKRWKIETEWKCSKNRLIEKWKGSPVWPGENQENNVIERKWKSQVRRSENEKTKCGWVKMKKSGGWEWRRRKNGVSGWKG